MKTSEHLKVGQIYTREELRGMFNITDATLNTGVFRPQGHDSVWLFVTLHKTPDRAQYSDFLDGDILQWDGQTSGRTDSLIINHKSQGLELLLFYRKQKYEYPKAAFRCEGSFEYVSHTGKNPTHFMLKRVRNLEIAVALDLESLEAEEELFEEGGKKQRYTNYYERDRKLRVAAIAHHGTKCMVCGFDFENLYGEHGKGYIEVHHLTPVSSLNQKQKVNPKTDMAVVCSNCHRMIHRRKDKVLSIEELQSLMEQRRA
jgi:predicted HNH restriction endonuclease